MTLADGQAVFVRIRSSALVHTRLRAYPKKSLSLSGESPKEV